MLLAVTVGWGLSGMLGRAGRAGLNVKRWLDGDVMFADGGEDSEGVREVC